MSDPADREATMVESLRDVIVGSLDLEHVERGRAALDALLAELDATTKERDALLVNRAEIEASADMRTMRADVADARERAAFAEAEAERYREQLRELSECVMRGWTEPAFVRGPIHEAAIEIARAALQERKP